MIFNTIEFLDSANKPLPVPDRVRPDAAPEAPISPRLPQSTPTASARHARHAAFAAANGLAKPPSILHTAANKPLGKRQNKP